MTVNRLLLLIVPMALMLAAIFGLSGLEAGLAGFGKTAAQQLLYGRAGIAIPILRRPASASSSSSRARVR